MWKKIQKWWWFTFRNPIVRKGEKGGFKWVFRRFWLEISTVSGNFKARWTAAEHPYAYLLAGQDDQNIEGFCQVMYSVGMLLTTEQKFVRDIEKALERLNGRLEKSLVVEEDDLEEKAAIEFEKQVQEVLEKSKKDRNKEVKEIKWVKNANLREES